MGNVVVGLVLAVAVVSHIALRLKTVRHLFSE